MICVVLASVRFMIDLQIAVPEPKPEMSATSDETKVFDGADLTAYA
jgi:hypothetical protein